MNKKEYGNVGEKIACRYLKENNYKIIDQNFYYRGGEIDIIAFDNIKCELVFIEVKTRANKSYGMPAESVDRWKVQRIVRGAKYYTYIHRRENVNIRFDVIEIFQQKDRFFVHHLKQII